MIYLFLFSYFTFGSGSNARMSPVKWLLANDRKPMTPGWSRIVPSRALSHSYCVLVPVRTVLGYRDDCFYNSPVGLNYVRVHVST